MKYGIWEPAFEDRITVVVGDLSKKRFGLSQKRFEVLAREIDTIYHNGAWVNFMEPYSRLKGPNVTGTREVLRLACLNRIKPVNYISSSSVYGTVGFFKDVKFLREDDDIHMGLGYGFNGYVQTKWVSEQMLWTAKERGLPICVFRCGLVMGHSKSGITNVKDFPSMMIKGCLQLGCYYDLVDKYDNFVPVDFASKSIVYFSLKNESHGKAFHIVNPHHISYADFWDLIISLGYQLEKLSFQEWVARFSAQAEANVLFPLMPLYLDKISKEKSTIIELFQNTPFYDTTNVDNGLKGTDISCPRIDKQLISTWVDYYIKSGFLSSPKE